MPPPPLLSNPEPQYLDPLPSSFPLSSLPPLTEERNLIDQKSLLNPPRSALLPHSVPKRSHNDVECLSEWYTSYPIGFDKDKNAFDFHIYYSNPLQTSHALKLHHRIRYEFPELRIYKFWDRPVGPHPVPMFEVNTFSPEEFGALFGFLIAYRGGLSVLVHPNTDDEVKDHTEKAVWMGKKLKLDMNVLKSKPLSTATGEEGTGTATTERETV